MPGRGRVRKRVTSDGRERFGWEFTVPTTDGGKRSVTGTEDSEKAAHRAMRAAMRAYDEGQRAAAKPPPSETVGDYLAGWLVRMPTTGLKRTTMSTYAWQIRSWVIPHLGHVPLDKLDAEGVLAWEVKLATTGSKTDGPLSRARCKAHAGCSPPSSRTPCPPSWPSTR